MIENAYRVASSLEVQSKRQEIISQNIANARMPGFKGRAINMFNFEDELGNAQGNSQQSSSGERTIKPRTNFEDGSVKNTERALDFALTGDGFFTAETGEGEKLLTRNGRFHVNSEGILQTKEGYNVQGQSGNIEIPREASIRDLTVKQDGTVQVSMPEGGVTDLGKLSINTVEDKQGLQRFSANYYMPGDDQNVEGADDYTVQNRAYETANVSAVEEMTGMIRNARHFQMGQKMISMLRSISRQESQHMN